MRDEWIAGVFGTIRCANCGAAYGLGVAIVKEVTKPAETQIVVEPAIGVDDVLEAHELLRDYGGDVHGLFDEGRRIPGR